MFNYDFMQNAFFVAICISLLCPCIGIFMVLRRSSMIGDTMSHASLAGYYIRLINEYQSYLRSIHLYLLSAVPSSSSCENIFPPSRFDPNHHLVT